MIFEKKHYDNPISKKLSDYLRQYTQEKDRADVAGRTNVSMSTIRDVIYRRNRLTENNSVAIIEMMKIAVKNCTNAMNDSREAKEYLLEEMQIEDWS